MLPKAVVLGGLVVGALTVGVALGALALRAVAPPEPPPESVTSVAPSAAVLRAVQSLARLETTRFHMERVIDVREDQRTLFGLVDTRDALLLVAAGDVVAGVDLAPEGSVLAEVDAERGSVKVQLPAPAILWARLDTERTYVHTRETGLLARRAQNLETRARQEAERSIRGAAVEAGILERAREDATRSVRSLLIGLGFREVQVEFRSPDGK